MRIEIAPDPPPGEREALAQALAPRAPRPAEPAPSAWWRAGIREALREAAGDAPPAD